MVDEVGVSKPKPKVRQGEIPIFQRVKARNMYLQQCLPYRAISEATGLPVNTLERLAHREGWTALRKEAKARILKAADTKQGQLEGEIVETVVAMASQHTIRTLEKVGEALERNDRDAAKDSQAYSATAKNLVSVVRAIRDNSGEVGDKGTRMELNLFFMGQQAPIAQPKQAEDIDVKAVKSE